MAATTNNMNSPAYWHGHAKFRRLERAGNVCQGNLGGDLRGLLDVGGRPVVSGAEGGLTQKMQFSEALLSAPSTHHRSP